MWCLKQFIDGSFIREWKKIIAPSVKCNLCQLFTSALRALLNSWPRLNFKLGTIIFHHSPHEQSIFVYYYTEFNLRFLKTREFYLLFYSFIYFYFFLIFNFYLFIYLFIYSFIYLFIYFLAVEPIL